MRSVQDVQWSFFIEPKNEAISNIDDNIEHVSRSCLRWCTCMHYVADRIIRLWSIVVSLTSVKETSESCMKWERKLRDDAQKILISLSNETDKSFIVRPVYKQKTHMQVDAVVIQ